MSKIQYNKNAFIQIQEEIGKGGFGKVLKVLWTKGDKTMEVAAKKISLDLDEKKIYL